MSVLLVFVPRTGKKFLSHLSFYCVEFENSSNLILIKNNVIVKGLLCDLNYESTDQDSCMLTVTSKSGSSSINRVFHFQHKSDISVQY